MQMSPRRLRRRLLFPTITLGMIVGCDSDQRVVELSRESMNRQAEQNHEMASQNQAVTQTTQQLVQSESNIQHDASHLHEEFHSERSNLDQQRQDLEADRRSLSAERQRDSLIAQILPGVVAVVAAALPLFVCWYLARSLLLPANGDAAAAETLIEQLATQGPILSACTKTALPAPDESPVRLLANEGGRISQQMVDAGSHQRSALRAVIVLEGSHDVEFLKRISHILSHTDASIHNLEHLEATGLIVFVINNGGSIAVPAGLAANGPAEFHLLDREAGPTTVQRKAAAQAINARSNCRAFLTGKRSIENYLHPEAIREASGLEITFGDFDDVAELAAKVAFCPEDSRSWESLSRRARRRLRDKAKRWLNREAVDRMTPQRLAERDPAGEVAGWLRTISELAGAETATPAGR